MISRKLSVIALTLLLLVGAGCLGPGVETPTESPNPHFTEPRTPIPEDGTPRSSPESDGDTPVGVSHSDAASQPDPDKSVIVSNDWNRTVTVSVTVRRVATNETVYADTHELEAGTEREVYTTTQADPNGVERFWVRFQARNDSFEYAFETSACYGNAYGEIQDDGSLYGYPELC